ncbi:MAG: hypothetical protein WCV80_02965 [Candidatus Paceibacterota bacterium]|jgi:hypothetical protein
MNIAQMVKKIKPLQSARDGQMLMEAIIGISVALMGLLGVLTLLTRSLSYNHDLEKRLAATYLAAEGIELVHAKIDENYMKGVNWDSDIVSENYQGDYRSAALTPYVVGNAIPLSLENGVYVQKNPVTSITPFTRKITITVNSINGKLDEIAVRSQVDWVSKKGPEPTILEDHFYNWKPGVVPLN